MPSPTAPTRRPSRSRRPRTSADPCRRTTRSMSGPAVEAARAGAHGRGPATRAAARGRRGAWPAALAVLALVALALRLWGHRHGLPYVFNADENAHFVPRAIGFFGHGYD